MGRHTDVILSIGPGEYFFPAPGRGEDPDPESANEFPDVVKLNEWLHSVGRIPLKFLSNDVLSAYLFHATFKNIIIEDFLEAVWRTPWRHLGEVQVFYKEEDGDLWIVHTKEGWSALHGEGRKEGE